MKLRDIFLADKLVFIVTDDQDKDRLNWTITPTDFALIPEEENTYIVRSKLITPTDAIDCYLEIITPERIAEIVIKKNESGNAIIESIYDQEHKIIPAIASECFGNYELFYARENPEAGITILRNGLAKAKNKSIVAEDLGYILRDENRYEEAIEAFKISEEFGTSSVFIYQELANLYQELGQTDKQSEYEKKFQEAGVF